MKLKILGSASGMPTPGKNHSAVWISFSDKNILLDCGEGVASQLIKNHLDNETLDAVAISHFHPDHVSGIFMLLQMFYLQNRTKPLDIFLPERANEFQRILDFFYVFPRKLTFKINFYQMNAVSDIYSQIKEIPNDHLESYKSFVENHNLPNQLKSYSFLITAEKHKVFYTSDFACFDSIQPYISTSDLVILDAYHPSPEKTLEIIKRNNARFILTHGLSEQLESHLQELPKNQYEIANEELEITV